MHIDEIIALAKAGFTADQIGELAKAQAQEPKTRGKHEMTPEPTPEPTPGPTPEPKQEPEQEPKQEPEPKRASGADLAGLAEQMKELTAQMKLNALNSAIQPKPLSTEDIIANIINPPEREDK